MNTEQTSKNIFMYKNSEFSKTSKMNLLEKIFKIFRNTIFAVTFILDVGFNSKTTKMKLLERKQLRYL